MRKYAVYNPCMKSKLTPRQQEVLNYIVDVLRNEGRPPTQRQLAAHFGWNSDNSARQHLRLLEAKGAIELDPGYSRGIRVPGMHARAVLRRVPLVGKVAAGFPLEAIENVEDEIGIDPDMFPEEEIFALRVNGDSMHHEGIHDGDIAIVKKQAEAADGNMVVAMIDNEATLKFYHMYGRDIVLRAANPDYPDIIVRRKSEFSILGLVVGIVRRI